MEHEILEREHPEKVSVSCFQQSLDVHLDVVGHAAQDSGRFMIRDRIGQSAALLNPLAHVFDGIAAHPIMPLRASYRPGQAHVSPGKRMPTGPGSRRTALHPHFRRMARG